MGETVQQVLPDAEGKPAVWTITKQEIAREELPDRVLPAPAPRDTPEDERTDSSRGFDARAIAAWAEGDVREAVELFEAAIEADPDDWVPRAHYGHLLVLMTDYEAAYPHLERAAELAPEKPQVWVDLLTLYERSTLWERAAYARERVEELADGKALVRDEKTGMWTLEGESVFP
jgi:tetratricopeptide (TPR) repeat protein